jgi:tripartite-type tricarboxylate transporter receptor subunit TctC
MLKRRHIFQLMAAVTASTVAAGMVCADTAYPSKPVRVIVPFPAGGGTDILARQLTRKLSERLGQQFYVENIAGAGGSAGTAQAAKAEADGHTVLFAFSSFVVNPSLFSKVPYDPIKDFEPVTLAAVTTTVLITHPSIPATNLKELGDFVRANPGKHSFASGGFGTQAHLVGEQLRNVLDIDMAHVPFAGAGPSVVNVVGGHTPIGLTVSEGVVRINGYRLVEILGCLLFIFRRPFRIEATFEQKFIGHGVHRVRFGDFLLLSCG